MEDCYIYEDTLHDSHEAEMLALQAEDEAKRQAEDEADQAAYEAEQSRDTFIDWDGRSEFGYHQNEWI
jgi:hypothetical protein